MGGLRAEEVAKAEAEAEVANNARMHQLRAAEKASNGRRFQPKACGECDERPAVIDGWLVRGMHGHDPVGKGRAAAAAGGCQWTGLP